MKPQNYVRKHNSSSIFVMHDIVTVLYEKMKHEYKILLQNGERRATQKRKPQVLPINCCQTYNSQKLQG
jgi:hypothetical protein